ncbi:7-deoxyloganetin glucosyltransferase [Ranunculus cassubicifolius]
MGSISLPETQKPHCVFIPYPAQGHITPLLKLAKLFHHKGFHITFVNTEYNHRRLIKCRGAESVKGLPDFQFRPIPDGLPPCDGDTTQDIPALCESVTVNCTEPFRDLIKKINQEASTSDDLPPVSCILSDGAMSFTLEVAQDFGIPVVYFWTLSACGLLAYLHFPHLIERGIMPLKDESYLTNGYLDTEIDWIPGLNDCRLKDFPSFVRYTDPDDVMVKFFIRNITRTPRGSAIVINTFDEFEQEALEGMKNMFPPIYTIGCLHKLVNQVTDESGRLNSIRTNLWKEDPECIKWLDSKEPGSVVYVNFGSITVISQEELTEFAWGLANSKIPFLWVKRPDLVEGESSGLSPEFFKEIEGRGLIVTWCPQEQVLNHSSVGGFLTHSGWNSTLESICCGVPLVNWAHAAEQQTNRRYSAKTWGIGMEVDENVNRADIENLVTELIKGEKGKELKVKAMDWKKKAEKAIAPGGSSYENLDRLINEVLITKY